MICGNTIDTIDHPLPKRFKSAHGVSNDAWAPGPPPSKSGVALLHESKKIFVSCLEFLNTRSKV